MAENPNQNPTESVVLTVVEGKNNDKKEVQSDNLKPLKKKTPFKSIKTKQVMLPVVLITFLLSIPFIFEAIWLLYVQQYDCEGLLKSLPRLQIGIAFGLICVFFISNAVVFSRARRFVALGLIIAKFLLVLMFIVGLTFRGSFSMETRQIPGSPSWLKMMVRHGDKWDNIKSCLYDARMCRDLLSRSYNLQTYEHATSNLSPIESGCCNPPSICEMEYVNMTYWRKSNGSGSDINLPYDTDCDLWQNDETMLCYDCHACKQGFVETLESKWLKVGTFLIVMSLLLMISHLLLFAATMWEKYRI